MLITQAWHELLYPGDATDFFRRRPFPPFVPNAQGFSPANALWLAELCRLVYRHDSEEDNPPPSPTRASYLKKAGFRQLDFFLSSKTDTQAMLVKFEGKKPFAALVFRGTELRIKDFIIDLELGKVLQGDHKIDVHDGFEKALDSVWGKIKLSLNQLDCPVYFTGHSLGAAVATLAAARKSPAALYTFGSPRVGNTSFASSLYGVNIYRVIDDKDIVTTLPPATMKFKHVGIPLRLSAPKGDLLPTRSFNLLKPFIDHAPVNYVDRIVLV